MLKTETKRAYDLRNCIVKRKKECGLVDIPWLGPYLYRDHKVIGKVFIVKDKVGLMRL